MRSHPSVVGIDFGTTNSSMALATGDGGVQLASFPTTGEETFSFRSVLYFEQVKEKAGARRVHHFTGPSAIEHYLEADRQGRLIPVVEVLAPQPDLYRNQHLWPPLQRGTPGFADARGPAPELRRKLLRHARPPRPGGPPGAFCGSRNRSRRRVCRFGACGTAFTAAGFESVEFRTGACLLPPTSYESTPGSRRAYSHRRFRWRYQRLLALLRVGPGVHRRGRSAQDILGNSGRRALPRRRRLRRTHRPQTRLTRT